MNLAGVYICKYCTDCGPAKWGVAKEVHIKPSQHDNVLWEFQKLGVFLSEGHDRGFE